MSLLLAADLAGYMRVNATQTVGLQAAIDAAEAAVASFLGLRSLAEANVVVTLEPTTDSAFLDLRRGPLTSLTSMTRDGDPVTLDEVDATPWHLKLFDGTFVAGEEVSLVYKTGWTAGNLDGGVKQAILMTAASIHNRPDAAASNVGIQGVTFYKPDYISPTAAHMLRAWKRSRL